MERDLFALHLTRAAQSALTVTRALCWNTVAEQVNFLIRPDTLSDEAAPYLTALEWARFQERKRELGQPLTAAEVVARLWVEQQVPVYINMSVAYAGANVTTLELLIDRRLRQARTDLYHEEEGYLPFHVAVPTPPYVRDRNTTFHSNWQHWPWRIKLVLWHSWWRTKYWVKGSYPT